MKNRLLLSILLFIVSITSFAQVKRITLPQLEKRISNTDTVYVVNFWATWCGPCVAELPYFNQLQTTYAKQLLKVLLVSMDFDSKYQAVNTFVRTHKLVPEVYLASRKSDQEFIDGINKDWSGALPGTLIVNGKKGFRQFFEQEFTYDELNKLYQTHK
ncbi:TlpA family protein disulfide reductase [Mucilaginibacter robiniae]|uniref:TlpA family protein disulfide reductase n=1 Tax=Mucilaginibacter robiniae TaxID=2728022 RepID=A0A7L5E1X0_9SPHI|nr:TlpA disulfide reductase family protein [Mucilaginibacter robiniae]QJD94823.1 TlpA family protein disulfide reductase [Mucilaginibacter robiniae]